MTTLLFLMAILYSSYSFAGSNRCLTFYGDFPKAVKMAILSGAEIEIPEGVELSARILRGRLNDELESGQFGNETLTQDYGREIIMTMGNDGIKKMPHLSDLNKLNEAGYPLNYVSDIQAENREHINAGRPDLVTKFKLLIFERSPDEKQATWAGLGEFLAQKYGRRSIAYQLFKKYKSELEPSVTDPHETSVRRFQIIENDLLNRYGMSFKQIYKSGPAHPLYMTKEKLKKTSELWAFRGFLYNIFRLNELYQGNGKTLREDGAPGFSEFFKNDQEIGTLRKPQIIDMEI